MDIKEALAELGAMPGHLSTDEKRQLDELGYLHLPRILTPGQVEAIKRRQAELLEAEGDKAGTEVHQERGTDRLSDLINKGEMFHVVITQPRVLAAIAHVLQYDLKLSSLNSRNALPGQGLQSLHADWGRLETVGDYQVCNSLWMLDALTPDNGATRVVPGSHRTGKTPSDDMPDPTAPHPDEILVLGQPGDVVVVNSHTWHGGTVNRTNGPRRVMHGYFCRRHQQQQLNQQRYLCRETWDRLSPAARVVLGVTEPAN
ncbi:MAG TPA: phytanoyl-CoA dioxygenase family protein [Chthonomonadaceae bacterium]|nr:phytanoyl-CoA dioxygenase family protein [Chthonomonadaceae bacterium]